MAEAAGSSSSSSSWMVEIEKMLRTPSAEKERWERQCIYRVPGWIKDTGNSKAYRPQVVALGPFHHDDPDLQPMEEHKRRAVAHLLKRSGKPLTAYIAAVEEVSEQLEAAYGKDLGKEWRGENRRLFVEMMVTDGCFFKELIQYWGCPNYVPESGDPFFSEHSFLHMRSIIISDVLVMENQLPLLIIQSLFAVENDVAPDPPIDIHQMVLDFLGRGGDSVGNQPLALHPLDLYHSSLTFGSRHDHAEGEAPGEETMPCAVVIHEAGVHFRKSDTDSLLNVHFNDGVLNMPALAVDDGFESIFLNLLAFERLHAAAGNDVTAYMFFIDNVVDQAEDVSLLRSKEILQNYLGSDKALAKLFNALSNGTVLSTSSDIGHVHRQVNAHCSKPWNKWRAYFTHTYLSNPWVFLSLVAATILLVATLVQTFYTVMPFYQQIAKFLGL